MTKIDWEKLASHAWDVREKAYIIGKTKVGAALLSESGNVFTGCNVEHRYRNHDVHAEVNAISNMVANAERKLLAIVIVSDRLNFSPCGSCLDWIFQFGGMECLVGWQSTPDGLIQIFKANELMPYYPY